MTPTGSLTHHPVMWREVLDILGGAPALAEGTAERPAWIIDATFGHGGHSARLLHRFDEQALPHARILAIDRDPHARVSFSSDENGGDNRLLLEISDFSCLSEIARRHDISLCAGILMDLGVSTRQLLDPLRGFSLRDEGPLDMRMDPDLPLHAGTVVNSYPEERLSDIFHEYGEERFARRIARRIVRERKIHPLGTTLELARLVSACIPRRGWQRIHPATRVFQALRIEVNGELDALRTALDQAIPLLAPGGRIVIISFHSLEDRIVKHHFRGTEELDILTRKPLLPSAEEVELNPRARSAKLRAAEKKLPP